MTLTTVEHLDPACQGWSVLVDQPVFADQRPRQVELICWTCRQVIGLTAWTPASDDPGAYDYDTARDIPLQHRPALAISTASVGKYPASVPPERVGGALVHVEAWLYGRAEDAYQWLVADRDGNVLGLVDRTWTDCGALRFRWATYGDAAGHRDGFHSRDAAVRALVRAVLPPRGGQAMSRGYRAHHDPTGARHGGMPTWPWRLAPDGLLTRRQLAAAGLRRGGQPPAGQVCWTSRRYSPRRQSRTRFAYLYRTELAMPRREPTVAQLVALAKADSARRTCPSCRQVAGYVIPRSLGQCLDCAEAGAPDQKGCAA